MGCKKSYMHYTHADIQKMERKYRLNLINCLSGFKSPHLIGTRSKEGISNLAVFSSVVHIGSNPPLMGFIMRPLTVERHTYDNIKQTQYFTLNHVQKSFFEKAHKTSAKFEREESEFEFCQLNEEYIGDFPSPFVKESKLKIALTFKEEIPIASNGCLLIIGQIEDIYLPDEIINEGGRLDLDKIDDICCVGLNKYYNSKKIAELPYARRSEVLDKGNSQS